MPKQRCRFCQNTKLYRIILKGRTDKPNYRCKVCGSQWSEQSQTIFKHSHLSAETRELMLRLLKENPEITSTRLAAIAGVTQKTAWLFKRRVMEGPKAVTGYWRGAGRLGKKRTKKECAGLSP